MLNTNNNLVHDDILLFTPSFFLWGTLRGCNFLCRSSFLCARSTRFCNCLTHFCLYFLVYISRGAHECSHATELTAFVASWALENTAVYCKTRSVPQERWNGLLQPQLGVPSTLKRNVRTPAGWPRVLKEAAARPRSCGW